jgi:PRTRC genetic system protein F
MFLDPVSTGEQLADSTGINWQPSRDAAAEDRSSAGFLTLPTLDSRIPVGATYKWPVSVAMANVIRAQFEHGALRASDVHAPTDARDAFNQAFCAWMDRQGVERRLLQYMPVVMDVPSVRAALETQYECGDFEPASELYFTFEMGDENIVSLASAVPRLAAAHPLLVPTILSLLDQVSYRTVLLRTPGWFLSEFACANWEGDEMATDEEARGYLEDMCGSDEEAIARLLPSAVRADIYPDELRFPPAANGRENGVLHLDTDDLARLRGSTDEAISEVCDELAALVPLIKRARRRAVFTDGHDGWSVYSASTVVLDENPRVGELLDDHFNMAMQGGDYTYCSCFIPFATEPRAVRRQYDDWALGFRMLNHVDRLLVLLSNFDEDTP